MTRTTRISDLIIPKFWPAFNDREHTHKILTSGRAGTKSSEAAIEVVYKIVSEEDCSAVVIRKRHNKLRKTVYKEIKRAIKRLGLPESLFKITVSPMEITYKPNGNTIYFTGSDSIDDTKGIIDESKPIKIVLLDEVSEFFTDGEGEDELQNIEATFIRGNAEGFQMLYLYNPPKNPNAPVVVWCRKMEKRPDCIHVHVDYRDVPPEWLGAKLIEAAEILHEVDERQWRWLWLGLSIGVDELHDEGGEPVVVTEGEALQLLVRHDVVLVDDGQNAQLQQAEDGVAHIAAALLAVDILAGEQHLGHGVVVLVEQLVVGIHQLALAHGGGGLLGGHILGPPGQVQLAHAHADGAGGHQNDLMSRVFQVAEHLAQPLHPLDVQAPCGVGQRGGAHLYNDTHTISPFRPVRTVVFCTL